MFKSIIIIPLLLIISSLCYSQSSSLIKIDGPQGGLVLSNLSGVERNALQNPENGLIIINSTTGCLNYYYNTAWLEFCGIIINTCDINGDCPDGELCIDGTCVDDPNACETSEECPEGMICIEGKCTNQ